MWPLWWVSAASAANVDITFCAEVDIEYDDMPGGDRWTDDTDKPARGFEYTIKNATTGATHSTGNLGVGLSNAGCVTVPLPQFAEFTIRYKSVAVVAGNTISAKTNNNTTTWVSSPFSITTSTTYVHTLPGSTEPRWNHLALAAFALTMHDLGLTGKVFALQEASSGAGAGDTDEGANRVDLSSYAAQHNRYRAGWELGRLMTAYRDTGGIGCASADLSLGNSYCDGNTLLSGFEHDHHYLRMMFQSRAGCDGTADFYNSLIWNRLEVGTQEDCEYRLTNPEDVDLMNDPPDVVWEIVPTLAFSCHNPAYSDWLWFWTTYADGALDCTGDVTNRGTREAWLNYYWQMAVEEEVPLTTLWQVWDDANPADWCETDNAACASSRRPVTRLETAANHNGVLAQHLDAENDGVDH